MNIAIFNKGMKPSLLTNENLQVGDKVFPLTHGYNNGAKYFVVEIDTSKHCSGWPDEPHTILQLEYSKTKAYEIRTDHGYGPRESYFKLIE
jgi:hypothetical protein